MLKIRQYPNRTVIKHPGKTEQFLRFVLEGAGVLLVEQAGKEICFEICFEDDFLTDFDALTTGRESGMMVKNFESIRVVELSRQDYWPLYKNSILGAHMGKILADNQHYKTKRHHLDSYLGLSARQRLDRFVANHPKAYLRAPQRYIASYLGMSAQTLSKLRNAGVSNTKAK